MKQVGMSSRAVPPDLPSYLPYSGHRLEPGTEPGSFFSEEPCLTKGEGEAAGTDLSRRGQERELAARPVPPPPRPLLYHIPPIPGPHFGPPVLRFSSERP